jgi:hypothetical protein
MRRNRNDSEERQLASHAEVDQMETTVKRNRFDFDDAIVIDREVFGLYEPMQNVNEVEAKAATTLTCAASRLARWHDILFSQDRGGDNA